MNNGKLVVVDTGKGFSVKYRGRFIYSPTDPVGSALRRIENLKIREQTLLFVPGVALGYGLKQLLAKLPAHTHVLCLEIDQELWQLAEKQQVFFSDPRLSFLNSNDIKDVVLKLRQIGTGRFRRLLPVYLNTSYALRKDEYLQFEVLLEEEIKTYWQNRLTCIHMGRLWIKNLFKNLAVFARCGALRSIGSVSPIIVVGAGASLEECSGLIKAVQSSCVIMAVDTALPVLAQMGIKPDLGLMLEAQQYNVGDFVAYPAFDIPLICDLTAVPTLTRLSALKLRFFVSRFYELALLDRLKDALSLPQLYPPLGSVGVAAVNVALQLTAGPVFLAGLDFAYTDHKTHARGAPINLSELMTHNRLSPLGHNIYASILKRPLIKKPGKQGALQLSDVVLSMYADRLRKLSTVNVRIFDLSPSGLELGIPRVSSATEILTKCGGADKAGLLRELFAADKDHGRVAVFLRAEQERLLVCERTIKEDWQAAGTDKKLPAIYSELDYLYYFFPDRDPMPNFQPDFLLKLLASVRAQLALLQRLNSGYSSSDLSTDKKAD